MAQDDYYYEIQLTNKQLVFYFMAGATGLILSFLAGVMVGKGVDSGGGEVLAARPVQEERVVAEEAPTKAAVAPLAARDLTYAQRLEAEKTDDSLDKAKGASPAPAGAKPSSAKAAARTAPPATEPPPVAGGTPHAEPKAPPAKAGPEAPAAAKAVPAGKAQSFTIQVVALKDKASAESVVTHLKEKGFYAYLASPEGDGSGLFSVRVGTFPTRSDAERTEVKLRDQEKFKPFIVKQQ
jgi:cell division septation protein DedD